MMQLAHFADYADAWLLSLQQQGKSAHTLAAYRRDLAQLVQLLPQERHSESPQRRHFVAALKKLSQQDAHPRSMARKLSVWRQYSDYLVAQTLLAHNPAHNLKAPKPPERLPKAVEQEALNRLLDQDTPDDTLAVRDHAIFELMYGSGLRLSEIHALDVHNVLLQEGWVSVIGKGNKPRRVPLVQKSIAALKAWLAVRAAIAGENALFTNRHGSRLSQRQIQNRLRQWALIQGSPQHLSRTCCATATPAICCKPHKTSAPCRNCSATAIYPPPRFTPSSTLTIWRKSTMKPTRGRNAKKKQNK